MLSGGGRYEGERRGRRNARGSGGGRTVSAGEKEEEGFRGRRRTRVKRRLDPGRGGERKKFGIWCGQVVANESGREKERCGVVFFY